MVTYFEPENVGSMAKAILELYRNKNRRQVQVINARKFIERYGWQNYQMELIRLYEDL
jgi:glycosyltransferase involved in cell wall biosynthesis